MTNEKTGGQKGVKTERCELVPVEPLLELARHYGIGGLKYDDDNWTKGYDWKFSYGALQRHAQAWWGGEEWTVEVFINRHTGEEVSVTVNHMIAVAWHAFALYYFSIHHRSLRPAQFGRFSLPSGLHQPYTVVNLTAQMRLV